MAKRKNDYFEIFSKMVKASCEAAQYLNDSLHNFDPETLPQRMKEIHEIEHKSDELKHDMMSKLAQEFVTPIDREDIILIASELDEVTDTIEDVLICLYSYGMKEVRPECLVFCNIIIRCCEALKTAVGEMHNFKKTNTLSECVINVNSMEEEGDAYYIKSVRALYTTEKDPIQVIAWSKIFDRLEECCDSCEHVANLLESVVLKNS